jgi:hypothetical protein
MSETIRSPPISCISCEPGPFTPELLNNCVGGFQPGSRIKPQFGEDSLCPEHRLIVGCTELLKSRQREQSQASQSSTPPFEPFRLGSRDRS